MKKYIRTEEVQAVEAIKKNGVVYLLTDAIPRSMHPVESGYKIIHADGSSSFMLTAEFNNAYQCVETPLDRMRVEHDNLLGNIKKLESFIQRDDAESIVGAEQFGLLLEQLNAMNGYFNVLVKRIELMSKS